MNNIIQEIKEIKKRLGKKVIIPVHHYQNSDIVSCGDFIGDSYKLAVESSRTNAEFIVFCGVTFMAESADILAKPDQHVLIPVPMAGCPMASMADMSFVQKAFDSIKEITGKKTAPIVYMNSFADLKNFCGINGGAVCTSSNAPQIIDHYIKKDYNIMFFPDYHLGKNTANSMGYGDLTVKVNRDGTVTPLENANQSRFFLWDGYCLVHQNFKSADIDNLKNDYPNIKIIVHPESDQSVVKGSDFAGSTEMINNMINNSPSGTVWGVGTETTFVDRIAAEARDKTVIPLKKSVCANMQKITAQKLLDSLLSVEDFINNGGALKYLVKVDKTLKSGALKAMNKMIDITEGRKQS